MEFNNEKHKKARKFVFFRVFSLLKTVFL